MQTLCMKSQTSLADPSLTRLRNSSGSGTGETREAEAPHTSYLKEPKIHVGGELKKSRSCQSKISQIARLCIKAA